MGTISHGVFSHEEKLAPYSQHRQYERGEENEEAMDSGGSGGKGKVAKERVAHEKSRRFLVFGESFVEGIYILSYG